MNPLLLPFATAGITMLIYFCLSPKGIFWAVSEYIYIMLDYDIPEASDVDKWDVLTGEKTIFFLIGLCPFCLGFWVATFSSGFLAMSIGDLSIIPYTIGVNHLILKHFSHG